jgi:hypothetical protein
VLLPNWRRSSETRRGKCGYCGYNDLAMGTPIGTSMSAPISTLLRFLQFFSLGTWVGSIVFFGAVVAPGAFTVLSNKDQAGALVGLVLGRLHLAGMVAGVVYLVVTAVAERSPAALVRPAPLLVVAMIVLTFISQFWVTGTMEALRSQMGSVDATPATNALRMSFDRLHVISVRLEMAVMACGIVALVLLSRKPTP